MKVMCIEGVKKGMIAMNGKPVKNQDEIYEGEIYTVSWKTILLGESVYMLSERSPFFGYRERRFIPLSDIDETELIKERELVNA